MPPIFPILQRPRIDSQPLCHLPLGQASFAAGCDETFRKRAAGRHRIVAKEPDDGRHIANERGGCVAFPARNGGSTDADLLRNPSLKEFQVQAAGAEMVA